MAKFKYRLATLLRLREAARDERRTELAEAYRVDDVLREQLRQVEEALGGLRARCRSVAGPGRVNVDLLVEAQRYDVALRTRQHDLKKQREAVAAEIERRRQAVVEADREVRVLEKLRQRQADRYLLEENRRQGKQLDEVAGQRAAREELV
ncbi:MAG: flagellar export protein FliJ [Planctomycetes bacterium RBG_13_63_9]|nr:MAG: flagellar export protein FliJ [Planctomycetes bacterium RBG_13_63_9]